MVRLNNGLSGAPAELGRFFASVSARIETHGRGCRCQVGDYFSDLARHLEEARPLLEEQYARNAPDFNTFECLHPQGLDEVGLSRVIADLLNPHGSHCQGDRFLSLFLRDLLRTKWAPGTAVRVVREDLTLHCRRPRRRIDITIDLGSRGIGIENKPWAEDGEDQLRDYKEHLDRKYHGHFQLVYLSGDGKPPKSIPAAERRALVGLRKFQLLTYSHHLANWLASCRDSCASGRVQSFLDDFRRYVRMRFRSAPDRGRENGDEHGE